MYKTIKSIILIQLVGAFSQLYAQEKMTIYTEDFPPYNYKVGAKIEGASTEMVKKLFETAVYQYELKSYPWARTYKLAQSEKNSFIYSISRRKNRENLFKWVTILTPSNYSVYALKGSNFNFKSLEDLKKFKIGTTIDDARESYLLSKGFTKNNFYRSAGNTANIQNYKMLTKNRIDLWPMPNAVAAFILKKEGIDINTKLEVAYKLEEISSGYYLAANLQTPDAVVKKLQEAMETLKKSGFVDELNKKWNLN